jgi:hypothetical protein
MPVPQNEIITSAAVLDDMGRPSHFGWARRPIFTYDKDLAWTPRRLITASDRFIIFSPTHIFSFEINDSGYTGCRGITVFSLRDKRKFSRIIREPFPLGNYNMPLSSDAGSITLRRKRNKEIFDFIVFEKGVRIIKIDIPDFGHHHSLRGEVVLSQRVGADSVFTNMSWPAEKKCFQYGRVSPWFTVEGVMQFESAEVVFTYGNAWGIFDWARIARPRVDVHYWAAACGQHQGRVIGFNAGYGTADSSAGTENAFFIDSKIHKLDQVTFQISPSDWMSPWRFTSNDKRLEMTLVPQAAFENSHVFFPHSRNVRHVFGLFSGEVITDSGARLSFKNLTGIAERRKTRL